MIIPEWRGQVDDAARVLAAIDAFAANPALRSLVTAFGGLPGSLRGAEQLAYLDDFAAAHWDFRGGNERNLAVTPVFGDGIVELVL